MTKVSNKGILPSTALSRALNVVGRASGKIDPSYEMVQLEVKNGKLTGRCFNGTMGILASIPVEDQGSGFDFCALPDPLSPENLLRTSGRGIFLIRCFMDEVELRCLPAGGLEIRMLKRVPPNGTAGGPARA